MAKSEQIEEIWKPIQGYEGFYEISNLGRVKSNTRFVRHNCGGLKKVEEHILSQLITRKNGYCQVFLWKNGKRKVFLVHRLVLHAFVGQCPDGMEVRHINSVPSDNRLCNLVYGTHSENTIDTLNLGKNGRQRLNPAKVKEIREKAIEGQTAKSLSIEYGVSKRAIQKVVNHTTYSWI